MKVLLGFVKFWVLFPGQKCVSGITNLLKPVPKLAKEMNKANLLNTYKTK